jgi:hypothetical protein
MICFKIFFALFVRALTHDLLSINEYGMFSISKVIGGIFKKTLVDIYIYIEREREREGSVDEDMERRKGEIVKH